MHVQAVISSTSQRVRVEGLGDLLDKDALHKLATSADADGQVAAERRVGGEDGRADGALALPGVHGLCTCPRSR